MAEDENKAAESEKDADSIHESKGRSDERPVDKEKSAKEDSKKPSDDKQGDQSDDEKADEDQDGRGKQKEFFKVELKRLKDGLDREKSKIKKPPVQRHIPYTFNTLEPYYNVDTAKYLIELPEEASHGYISRRTAIGLCDPWDNLAMDKNVVHKLSSRSGVNSNTETPRKSRASNDRPPKQGSTRLPKFPVVTMETDDLAKKELCYSDVPMLRKELHDKYSANAHAKIDQDYRRTKQDFYRMELDKMEDVHPISRPHMRNSYFAYLQNTPGSRKAVYECVKKMETSTH